MVKAKSSRNRKTAAIVRKALRTKKSAVKASARTNKAPKPPKRKHKKELKPVTPFKRGSIFDKGGLKQDKTKIIPPEPVRVPTEAQKQDLKHISKILADSHIRQMLIELGGENALAIIRNFFGNHSDEELAKRLKLKISDVRATLNRLHNEGLVNYIREKDNETGWYSYSWSLNIQRMERWVSTQSIGLGISRSENGQEFYFCPTCGTSSIINFETASNWSFRCGRCDRLLDFLDDKKMTELYDKERK